MVGAFLIAGIQIGGWLDDQLSSRPIFLTAGVLLGLLASFSVFWRIYRWQSD
ncbi:MAG: AtpZ/AtpI family protein [Chloroflexota bacterium]|nr:AtpZ/AtpI family protein [Chloroflexota bacterium]